MKRRWVTRYTVPEASLRSFQYRNSKSTKDVLKRIDYLGSLTLLISVRSRSGCPSCYRSLQQVGSCLIFLSTHYNSILPVSRTRSMTTALSTHAHVAAVVGCFRDRSLCTRHCILHSFHSRGALRRKGTRPRALPAGEEGSRPHGHIEFSRRQL